MNLENNSNTSDTHLPPGSKVNATSADASGATLTTQGGSDEQAELLGGTTNLSLEQLKAEGDNNDSDTEA